MKMQPKLVAQARLDTPLGPMTAAATDRGLAGLWFDGQAHHPGPLDAPNDPSQRWLVAAAAALAAYFDGKPAAKALPLDLHGTPFQRAAGAAIGRNPVSVLVPCHRVVGSDGSLTGYAGGLARKRALLRHEGVAVAA